LDLSLLVVTDRIRGKKGGLDVSRKKTEKSEETSGEESSRVMITRRLPRQLWDRLQTYAASFTPRTTDTAIIELALTEYLDRHEGKGKR
jgi:hypothetical protein